MLDAASGTLRHTVRVDLTPNAALSTVVNYRLLIITMTVGVALASLYLFSRPITPLLSADEVAGEGAGETVTAGIKAGPVRGS